MLKRFLVANSRLLTNSSEVEDCEAAKTAPRGFLTLNHEWIAVIQSLMILKEPRVMKFDSEDPFKDDAEGQSKSSGYTPEMLLKLADLYEYPRWEIGTTSRDQMYRHLERQRTDPNYRDDDQMTYFDRVKGIADSISDWTAFWAWVDSELIYYGSICSILIMIGVIGFIGYHATRQMNKYRDELLNCCCANWWMARLIQACRIDSWSGDRNPPKEMKDMSDREENSLMLKSPNGRKTTGQFISFGEGSLPSYESTWGAPFAPDLDSNMDVDVKNEKPIYKEPKPADGSHPRPPREAPPPGSPEVRSRSPLS